MYLISLIQSYVLINSYLQGNFYKNLCMLEISENDACESQILILMKDLYRASEPEFAFKTQIQNPTWFMYFVITTAAHIDTLWKISCRLWALR